MRWIFFDFLPWDYDVAAPLSRPMGGSQSALCYLARALARRGHDVTVVTGKSDITIVDGVRCVGHRQVPMSLLGGAVATVLVVLNGPAEMAVKMRAGMPRRLPLVLWTQHDPGQPAMKALASAADRAAWDRIVCVSDWQRNMYLERLGVPLAQMEVLRNAIAPAFENLFPDAAALAQAKSGALRLAYTSTPFRGLESLLNVFPAIRQKHPACELAVFSSMLVYGDPPDADEFKPLYQRCQAMEGVRYRASLPQPALAGELAGVSVLAYPNTFAETSCIAVMEGLASGALVVTSNLGALPETCAGFGQLVAPIGSGRTREQFEQAFADAAEQALAQIENGWSDHVATQQFAQVAAIRDTCTWNNRALEWEAAAAKWISQHG